MTTKLEAAQPLDDGGPAFGQWQPIETAPKDGTEILVAYPVGNVSLAYGNVFDGEQYWQRSYAGYESLEATHWMPLPPPPADAMIAARKGGSHGE